MAEGNLGGDFERALAVALGRLRRSDAFEAEIRAALESKRFAGEVADRVVAALREKRLLDDRQTAERWVASRIAKRAEGPDRMRSQLMERGAAPQCIEEALAGYGSSERLEAISALLKSRFRNAEDRAKAGRLLISRGFAEDEVETALDTHFGPA